MLNSEPVDGDFTFHQYADTFGGGTLSNGNSSNTLFRPGTALIKPVVISNLHATPNNLVTWQDIVVQSASLETVAQQREIPVDTLRETIAETNEKRTANNSPTFDESQWTLLGPAKAYFTTTEGGAAINQQFQTLNENGNPVPGLYAVGQTGLGAQILWGHGLHIAWAMTSGRLVGQQLAS